MKKGIYLVLVAGLLLGVSTTVASAEESTGTTTKNEVKEVKKAAVKSVLTEEKQAAINQYASNMISNFGNILNREQNFGMRLASLIQKYESEGYDMTAASAKLAEGQNLWQKSVTAVSGLQAEIDKMIAASKPKTAFAAVKKIVKTTSSDIKALHTVIIDTIKLMREAKPAAQATTTIPQQESTSPENAQ